MLATILDDEMVTVVKNGEANEAIGIDMLMDGNMTNENNLR